MPDSNPMDFHEKQFAVIELLLWMRVQERQEPRHELRDDLRVAVQLNANAAEVAGRRIGCDVGEVAIEGEKNRAQFLSLGDDHRIKRADGQDFPQQRNVMPVTPECVRDFSRHALVAEEAEAHAVTASKSANSRA